MGQADTVEMEFCPQPRHRSGRVHSVQRKIPPQSSPLLGLSDPDERGAVLSVRPELVARLDHVVAEILVVGHHLPLQAQLFGRDVVVEQDLRPDGWRGESDEILIARAAWPSLAWPRPSKKNFKVWANYSRSQSRNPKLSSPDRFFREV